MKTARQLRYSEAVEISRGSRESRDSRNREIVTTESS